MSDHDAVEYAPTAAKLRKSDYNRAIQQAIAIEIWREHDGLTIEAVARHPIMQAVCRLIGSGSPKNIRRAIKDLDPKKVQKPTNKE